MGQRSRPSPPHGTRLPSYRGEGPALPPLADLINRFASKTRWCIAGPRLRNSTSLHPHPLHSCHPTVLFHPLAQYPSTQTKNQSRHTMAATTPYIVGIILPLPFCYSQKVEPVPEVLIDTSRRRGFKIVTLDASPLVTFAFLRLPVYSSFFLPGLITQAQALRYPERLANPTSPTSTAQHSHPSVFFAAARSKEATRLIQYAPPAVFSMLRSRLDREGYLLFTA